VSWKDQIENITREGDPDQLVTAKEAARLLAVHQNTVHKMRRSGELACVVLSERVIRYRMSDLRQLIRERTQR